MTDALTASSLVRALGLSLLEFVWQGAAIGVVTAGLLMALRQSAAQWRYAVACLGLAAMAVTPVVTTAGYLRDGSSAVSTIGVGAPAAGGSVVVMTVESPASAPSQSGSAMFSTQWLEPRLPFLVLLWSAGVVILASHLLYGWLALRRIRRRASDLGADRWPAAVRSTARRLGLTRLRVLVSSNIEIPAAIGFLRPAIVVPASALAGLPPAYFEAILLHEIAHIRRADYAVNVVQCLVEILLFYHPAVWWVSSQIRREREHCCDDVAAALCADRVTYARALTSMEELRVRTPAPAVGADGGELLHRIRRVLAPHTAARPRLSGGFAMSVVVAIAFLALNAQLGSSPGTVPQTAAPVVQSATSGDVVATERPSTAVPQIVVPEVVPPVRSAPAPRTVRTPPRSVRRSEPTTQTPAGTSTMNGIVQDEQGGAVPGATVRVIQARTSVELPMKTNGAGRFSAPNLSAGTHELVVSLPGFRTARSTIEVPSGQTLTVVVRLELGRLTETVTVNGGYGSGSVTTRAPRQIPANPQTADDFFTAARALYDQGRFEEASAMNVRAVQLLREVAPEPPVATPQTVAPQTAAPEGGPVRVGGYIQEPKKIRHVPPIYPTEAVSSRVEGMVVLEAVIGKDGIVKDVVVVRSVPMLDEAARTAVRMWMFTPTRLNGVPVEVAMTVTVHFAAR